MNHPSCTFASSRVFGRGLVSTSRRLLSHQPFSPASSAAQAIDLGSRTETDSLGATAAFLPYTPLSPYLDTRRRLSQRFRTSTACPRDAVLLCDPRHQHHICGGLEVLQRLLDSNFVLDEGYRELFKFGTPVSKPFLSTEAGIAGGNRVNFPRRVGVSTCGVHRDLLSGC